MLKKTVFLIAAFSGLLLLSRFYGMHRDKKEFFYPYNHAPVHIKAPLSKPILFAYMTDRDWDVFEQWIAYWAEEEIYQAVFILNYEGKSLESWHRQIEAQSYALPVYFLENFDSSVYPFYPMAQAPAFYYISEQWQVQGPFYRYEQIPQTH